MKRMLVLVVLAATIFGGCEGPTGPISEPTEPGALAAAAIDKEPPRAPDIGRGLVGWWKLDETSGKTAVDSSGNGRNGTLVGESSFDDSSAEGRIGTALNVGKDDYVQIEGYKGIVGTGARTVSAWIKTKSDNGWILSWGRDEGGGMFMFGFIRGRDRIGVTPQGGYLYMNDRTNDDKWHHVAAVVEQAELPNLHDHVTIYLDGGKAEIHDIGILDLWPIDTGSELDVTIGKGIQGTLDDVRIYDRPLSEQEIDLLFKVDEK